MNQPAIQRLTTPIQQHPSADDMKAITSLFEARDFVVGEALARDLTRRFPLDGFGWKALGAMLHPQGKKDEALEAKTAAARLLPNDAEAACNLGQSLQDAGHYAAAEEVLTRALCLRPDYAEAHNNLAITFQKMGRIEESEASFVAALALTPNHHWVYDNYLFTLNYHASKPAEEIFAAYQEYEKRFGLPHRGEWEAHPNERSVSRRLKVGYVSPDFRNHACIYFLEPLLANHNKADIEIYAYADLSKEDNATARYKTYAEHWIATRGMSDAALAQRIRADGIDILVDLAGHTAGNRLGVFARKPAPVSLSWMGYGYTTGLRAIDYYLTDEASAPLGCEPLFSEEPWRLQNTPFAVYRPGPNMAQPVNPLPASSNGYITLGTLTRGVRINEHTIRVWANILKRLGSGQGSAHLVIDSASFKDPAVQEATLVKFIAQGIERERLHIGFNSPASAVLQGIDIGLDCFPHNSGTTLYESLYMGVPYITLAGRPSVGRIGSAILQGLGRPEWIAHTEQDYEDKVVALASDEGALAELRASLRGQMQASALMDEAGFAAEVERAYRAMFARWVSDAGANRAERAPSDEAMNDLVRLFNEENYLPSKW